MFNPADLVITIIGGPGEQREIKIQTFEELKTTYVREICKNICVLADVAEKIEIITKFKKGHG